MTCILRRAARILMHFVRPHLLRRYILASTGQDQLDPRYQIREVSSDVDVVRLNCFGLSRGPSLGKIRFFYNSYPSRATTITTTAFPLLSTLYCSVAGTDCTITANSTRTFGALYESHCRNNQRCWLSTVCVTLVYMPRKILCKVFFISQYNARNICRLYSFEINNGIHCFPR